MTRWAWLARLALFAVCYTHYSTCKIAWLPDREPITVPVSDVTIFARELYTGDQQCCAAISTFNISCMDQQQLKLAEGQAHIDHDPFRAVHSNSSPFGSSQSE